jgi:hypothetical protein
MKCPPIGLDDPAVNDKVWIISKVFGSTSLVLEVLILFPVWHQTTKGQLNCMLHFWIANLLGSIGNLTPRWWSWESAMCYDEFTLRTASSTTCFVTAFGALVALTAVAYWLMFAMYTLLIRQPSYKWLAISSHLDDRYTLLTERNILLAIGWGVPSIQFLIALCSGWLNSSAGPLACSVDPTIYNGWALNGLIFVPLTIVLSISTIIICIVMFLVIKHGFGAIKSQWRILAVGAYYVVAVWVVLGYAWHSYAERDDITKAVVAAIGASVASGGTVDYQKARTLATRTLAHAAFRSSARRTPSAATLTSQWSQSPPPSAPCSVCCSSSRRGTGATTRTCSPPAASRGARARLAAAAQTRPLAGERFRSRRPTCKRGS